MGQEVIVRARHLFPVSRDPIADGAVVARDGRIEDVCAYTVALARYPNARLIDLGESLLVPAAVNAHTHLELTNLAGRIPPGLPFAEWIIALVRASRSCSPEDFRQGAQNGVQLLLDAGTAGVGEICTHGQSVDSLAESGLLGVVYYELLGVDPSQAETLLERGQRQIALWRERYAGTGLRFGLSLHTPYTVSARLFQLASQWLQAEGIPFCVHAAESPAESRFLATGDGPIADTIYASAGWPHESDDAPGCSPIEYLRRLGALEARPLLVHGVQVDTDDLVTLARALVTVAHCPRSNAWLGCGRLRYAAYRRAGVHLALGTDSLASSPSLSLWDEAASAYNAHTASGDDVRPADLLRLVTLDGATALALEKELGSLDIGKRARLACATLKPLSEREREHAGETLQALMDGRLRVQPVRM